MKDTELKRLRDRDLYSVYRRALTEHTFMSQCEAADFARKQQAPRYYISSKVLSTYIGLLESDKELPRLHPNSYKRLIQLYTVYKQYIRENQPNLTRERICEIILDFPAPEFYIGREMAIKIISAQRIESVATMIRRFMR